jgi:hypothetical protein
MLPFLDSLHEHRPESRAVLGYITDYLIHLLADLGVGHDSLHILELLEVSLPSISFLRVVELPNYLPSFDTFL